MAEAESTFLAGVANPSSLRTAQGGGIKNSAPGNSPSPSSLDTVHFTPESSNGSSSGSNGNSPQDEERGPVDTLLKTEDDIETYELHELGSITDDSDLGDYMEDTPRSEDDNTILVYTAEEERAVVQKFDRRLVLFVALLYMLSFLDRSNIGNAYAAGMDEDLLRTTDPLGSKHGPDYYYEWALAAFYIAYIGFEWLSLLWTTIPAHIYVSGIVLSWGVVASLQSVAGSYPSLIRLRFLLGIGEAGFTGIPIFLSFFFRREELAFRTAVFISAAPLATAFASSLAWLIIKLGHNGPIAPWRLLFLIEGFPAVLVATLAWKVIPDSPESASYLTEREKRIARQRLLFPSGKNQSKSRNSHDGDDNDDDGDDDDMYSDFATRCCQNIFAVLQDPTPWTTAAIFFLTNVAYSSLPVFLPSILTQMGHSGLSSQALAAPPYLVSFITVLFVAIVSDELRSRAYLIAASALVSAVGYSFLALSETINTILGGGPGGGMLNMMRYLAIYPATVGFFCVVVLTISWNVNNARGAGHKGGGFVLMQAIGQCGPLVGTRLYPKSDRPWFTRGMGICAVAMFGVACLAVGLRQYLARKNRQLDEKNEDGDSDEEEGLVGGNSETGSVYDDGFRYML